MISGSRMRDGVKPGPASHIYLTQLAAAPDEAARQAIWAELSQTSRLAFVRRWIDHPDFDLGVVMAWGFREFARDPLLAPIASRAGARLSFVGSAISCVLAAMTTARIS